MAWKGPKNGQFGAKTAIFGHEWPLRPPMAGKIGTNGGSPWNTCGGTNLDEKLVRKVHLMAWKGTKNGQFWTKTIIFGHKWPLRPPMAGKSGPNGGSQWNTCEGTTLDAKLVRQMHPIVWKWPILVQMRFFLGIRGPRDPRGMVKVGQMVDHSETCVGELL